MSAVELAAAIRSWPASSQDVVAHLRRIAAVNPTINAVTLVRGEQALATAQRADRAVTAGTDLTPWRGVPATVQETIDLAGIPLGRTNGPDLRMRWHTDRCLDAAGMIEDGVGNIMPVDPGSGVRIAGGWPP